MRNLLPLAALLFLQYTGRAQKFVYDRNPVHIGIVPRVTVADPAEDNYDGSFQERRFVTHTLTFTMKTNVYGPVTANGVILTSQANLSVPGRKYTATSPEVDGTVTENWESQF